MNQAPNKVSRLNEIGIALSAEKELPSLLERILKGAKELTGADGGSLYRVTSKQTLRFEVIATDSLNIAMGGTTGKEITFPEIPLQNEAGLNLSNVVTCAVNEGQVINIDDVYQAVDYDFSGTRIFDQNTGYKTQSILTIPLKNHEDDIIGALQLINALDEQSGEVIPFSREAQNLAKSLASQAAVALTNQKLVDDLQQLFESFIQLIATAIDEKSPYTGSHCRRIPVLTMMLAEACHDIGGGALAEFNMSDQDRYELRTAAWLHDCGKITSPEYVMDKATKLETIFDRIELVDTRIEVLKRDAEITMLRAQLAGGDADMLTEQYQQQLLSLEDERAFLRTANIGGEFMTEEAQQRVEKIAQHRWFNPDGDQVNLLNEDEVYNLNIAKGTLTAEERTIINNHMVATINMLEALPFPKHLQRVPEYAGGHHEKMDGTGYPKGLRRDEMSVPARVMAIADIFEALSARDRPYKQGKTLTECLRILGFMCKDDHIDPDIFDVFVKQKVYMQFAEEFMHPEQIDEVDVNKIPGYAA